MPHFLPIPENLTFVDLVNDCSEKDLKIVLITKDNQSPEEVEMLKFIDERQCEQYFVIGDDTFNKIKINSMDDPTGLPALAAIITGYSVWGYYTITEWKRDPSSLQKFLSRVRTFCDKRRIKKNRG